MVKSLQVFWLAVCFGMVLTGVSSAEPAGKLIIFHAGSLSVPFEAMEKTFEAAHPGVDILREAGGSTKMARLISEVGKPADIMASADYKVIDNNLIPGHASWNVRFATNQLVLTYTEDSKYADQITADNWHEILRKKDVVWGHSDPNLDPCGYRSLMVLQLAEIYYGIDGLYGDLLANRPEKNIRPKSVELVNLLKTGHMDYAWEYISVAVQHGLKYVKLDDHINLGNYAFDDMYAKAEVKVTGKKPGTFITKKGQSCTYGVTMTKDAANPEAAVLFLQYLLDPKGGAKVLEEMGQPPLVPAVVPTQEALDSLPDALKPFVEVAK